MGKKLFWSRDRLVKHEFDCFRLGLGLGLWLGLWIASGLWLGFDSRCQSFTARRGPVVHLADLVVARICAARPSSASRYKVRVRVGIRVYVKPFCSAAKP